MGGAWRRLARADEGARAVAVESHGRGDGSVSGVDCDDNNPQVHPGAAEINGDSIDENCDGAEACFQDADGDESDSTLTITVDDDKPVTLRHRFGS